MPPIGVSTARFFPAIVIAILTGICLAGCGSGEEEVVEEERTRRKKTSVKAVDPGDFKPPEVTTHEVTIRTPVPGFYVLIDNEAARTSENELLTTPCAVNVAAGTREIRITHNKFRDESRQIKVAETMELNFDPFPVPDGDNASVRFAPYFEAEVGTGIPLLSINTEHAELDPFLEPDGLAIWFVSKRPTGVGIYRASRPTQYHAFDTPRFEFRPPGSGDLPAASPSVTKDALLLVYTTPARGEIWGVPRPNALAGFEFLDRYRIKNTNHRTNWPAAQVLYNSSQVFWVVDEDEELKSFVADRSSKPKDETLTFGSKRDAELPGIVPCLSSDGLRQFAFDGKTLSRAVRPDIETPFSKLDVRVTLPNALYTATPGRRQFFVTDDEQWLFYVPDPSGQADMWVTRLFDGKGWGTVATGRTIERRTEVAVAPEMPEQPKEKAGPQVDPRSLPLPYTTYFGEFQKLLSEKQYAAADALVKQSLASPNFAQDKVQLGWDQEDVGRIKAFWADVRKAVAGLKVGDMVRIGASRVRFVRFENDEIVAKARTKNISKPLLEMTPTDLAAIAESDENKADAEFNMRVGTYFFYDPDGNKRSAAGRFERAGDQGKQFHERLASRVLHQAQREFERENPTIGRGLLSRVQAEFPDTQAASDAKQREGELWKLTKWTKRGSRNWQIENGDFAADNAKQPGSFLVSDQQYEAFELQLEWKTLNSNTAYGGVFFRYPGSGRPSDTAFKLNLANDFGAPADNYSTGALFKYQAPEVNAVKPTGQWNTLKMRVNQDEVQVTINGRLVLETAAVDADIPTKGYIALDGDLGGITYRKPLIMEIPIKKSSPKPAPKPEPKQ